MSSPVARDPTRADQRGVRCEYRYGFRSGGRSGQRRGDVQSSPVGQAGPCPPRSSVATYVWHGSASRTQRVRWSRTFDTTSRNDPQSSASNGALARGPRFRLEGVGHRETAGGYRLRDGGPVLGRADIGDRPSGMVVCAHAGDAGRPWDARNGAHAPTTRSAAHGCSRSREQGDRTQICAERTNRQASSHSHLRKTRRVQSTRVGIYGKGAWLDLALSARLNGCPEASRRALLSQSSLCATAQIVASANRAEPPGASPDYQRLVLRNMYGPPPDPQALPVKESSA